VPRARSGGVGVGDGVELELRVRGERPRLAVTGVTQGLDGVPGFRPRPADVVMTPYSGSLPADSVTVVGSEIPGGAAHPGTRQGRTISR
jgi:hypothetical protein